MSITVKLLVLKPLFVSYLLKVKHWWKGRDMKAFLPGIASQAMQKVCDAS